MNPQWMSMRGEGGDVDGKMMTGKMMAVEDAASCGDSALPGG
jgi:hypothetical protein